MKLFLLCSLAALLIGLAAEQRRACRDRAALKHVIHVNGTRGKSGVTRLIAAGLTGAGIRTFCKTTGTLPMTIDPDGKESIIPRRGAANISEQLKILRQAAESGAEVLVIECMALDPELQFVSQHRMLCADIGVITNVRVDHVAEMGGTVPEVCEALSNTIPKNGVLVTAERDCFPQLSAAAKRLGTRAVPADTLENPPEGEPFPENLAVALASCVEAGADPEKALAGMARVQRDPYAVSCTRLKSGALFLNGMAANDPMSTAATLERFLSSGERELQKKVFILNCRADRGYRTELMLNYLASVNPDEIWLIGKGAPAARRQLKQKKGSAHVEYYRSAELLPLREQTSGTLLYAIGNIADDGMRLMELVKEEADTVVW